MKTFNNFNKTLLNSINLKTILFSIALVCFTQIGFGQTTISIDFETANDGYTPSTTIGSGFTDVFNRSAPNIGGNSTNLWAVEDIDGSPTINLDQINVSGASEFIFSIDWIAHHYNDWDGNTEFSITYSLDNGIYQNLIWVRNICDCTNAPAAVDLGFDGTGDCGPTTTIPSLSTGTADGCTVESSRNQFETYLTNAIALANNSTLDIRLSFANFSQTDQGIYLDNIEIVHDGTASSSPTIGFDAASSSQTETDETFNVSIPVTVSNYGTDQIDVSIAVSGSAEVADYTLNTASLSFTSDGSQNISLDINPDIDDYDDETITLTLTETSSVSGLVISQSTHTLTIADDEIAPSVGFDTATSSETETDATFNVTIPVTVSSYSGTQIDVSIAASGTAEGGDFTLNTASLSFTADGSQNISLDINDDVDTDEETVILTITETSAVTGLVISQSTHTLTIIDDELPPVPSAGSIFITEVLDSNNGASNDYLELFNNSNEDVSLYNSKLIRFTSAGSYEYTYDFGEDESNASTDIVIPAHGFLIIARGNTREAFNTAYGITLDASVYFNGGNSNLFFGTGRRWKLKTGGSANTDDGTLIDDTSVGVGSSKSYRNIFTNTFTTGSPNDGTPGELEYIVYSGGSWVNSVAMDATTASENVYFYDDYTITSDDFAGDLGVATGNTLTIDETSSLTVSGDFTNDGTVTLNSTEDDFSSLIVTGTATGNITYNRYVNSYNTNALGGGWDLVGAPAGMSISAFIAANGAAGSNVIKVLGDDYAFSQYDNATGQWNRYATASQTGSFEAAQGYSMATNAGDGATVAFIGAMQTTSQSIDIINNNGLNNVGRRWNLVSNPFPSFINGNTAAGTTNFLGVNSTIMDGTFTGVYGWNGSSYTIYNLLDAAFSIAPGQAFWVAALNTTNTALNFTADMRTTTGTGDFVTGPQLLTYSVGLKLYHGESQQAATKLYFRDGLSLGLDPGYDAGAFNQATKLSTRLAGGSQETAFARNAMGMDAMQNTRVPLEIIQNAGQAFTISIADMDLPEDIYVYLEDTLNGTLTSLKDQDFELVAQNDLSGVDRFFVVFKSNSVLSSGDAFGIGALNVYKANSDSFVTIAGISPELEKLDVTLYSILGVAVKQTVLNTTTATQRVSTQGLASGLYIIQLKSGNQVFNKKIIVE
jgi:preprotein translocase subunit SecB